jgi:hypothetical protein
VKFKYALFAALALVLSGCASIDDFREACDSFGFKPGTDAYSNCVMRQSEQNDQNIERSMDRATYNNAKTRK